MAEKNLKNVLWIKTGWSDFYQGGPVNGNFSYLQSGRAKNPSKQIKEGHEKYNFLPTPDGFYCVYLPPQGKARSIPYDDEERTWTVVCLAKKPGQTGIHVVGWFERAYLLGQSFDRPEYDIGGFRVSSEGSRFTYSIKSDHAYLVHPNDRINPFSHSSVKTGKYSFLTLENEKNNKRKKEVLKILSSELKKLKSIAIKNPNTSNVEDFDNDEVDPVSGFGTPEHRKKVEKSAVKFVTNHLRKKGYNIISVEDQNCGYDLLASKGKSSLEVEVKGTAGSEERFFLTRNENFT